MVNDFDWRYVKTSVTSFIDEELKLSFDFIAAAILFL
jgi:hypothetical protein